MATLLEKLEYGIPSEQNIHRAAMMSRHGVFIQDTIPEMDETKSEYIDDIEDQSGDYQSFSDQPESLNGEEVIEDELWMWLRPNSRKFETDVTNVYRKLIENDLGFDDLMEFSKVDLEEIFKDIGLNHDESAALLSLIWDNENSVVYKMNSKHGVELLIVTEQERAVIMNLQKNSRRSSKNIDNWENKEAELEKNMKNNEDAINRQFDELQAKLDEERKKLINENNSTFAEVVCDVKDEIEKQQTYQADMDLMNKIISNEDLNGTRRKREILKKQIEDDDDSKTRTPLQIASIEPVLGYFQMRPLCDHFNERIKEIGSFELMRKFVKEKKAFEILFEDYQVRVCENPKVVVDKCKPDGCDLIITNDISSLSNGYDMIEHKIEYRTDACEFEGSITKGQWTSKGKPLKLKLKNKNNNNAKKKCTLGACKVKIACLLECRNYEIRCCSCLWSSTFYNKDIRKKWSKYSYAKLRTTFVRDSFDGNLVGSGMKLNGDVLSHPTTSNSQTAFFKKDIFEGKHHWKFAIKKCGTNDGWRWTIGVWRTPTFDLSIMQPPTERYFTKKRRSDGYGYMCNVGQLVNVSDKRGTIKYGKKCVEKDIVDMYCDMNKLELSFAVNGQHYGKAYTLRKGVYKAAVNLCKKGDKVLFMLYERK